MKNISFMGAVYSDVPAVTFPDAGGGVARFDDASVTTATASDVASGKVFLANDGTITTGTRSGGGGTDFIVTLSYDSQSDMWTPDKTLAEIAAAYSAEKDIATYAYNSDDDMIQASGGYYDDGSEEFWYWVDNSDSDASGDYTISSAYYLDSNGVTLDETTKSYRTTPADAIPSDVANGKVFFNADGMQTGTASGGSSSWTKVAETSYQISTTSTSAATVATWATGHSELWTSDKIVYVRVRDTAGKRTGYFYGSDTFFINHGMANRTSASSYANGMRQIFCVNPEGDYGTYACSGTAGYGVYPDTFYSDGRIRIRRRYNVNYSLTINSTYKVEVYLLDPPTGAPIFT